MLNSESEELEQALSGKIYNLAPSRKNYAMHRLDSYLTGNQHAAGNCKGLLTIEHVLLQTVDDNSKWSKIWICSETRGEWAH